jgi:hypothetical protein
MEKRSLKCIVYCFLAFMLGMIVICNPANALPPNPARIGGTVTLISATQVQQGDTGCEGTAQGEIRFTFKVCRNDGADFDPTAEDADGLNSQDHFVVDIPIHQRIAQPSGALPGDTAQIRVFLDGRELRVVSPPDGEIIVGNSGSITPVDLVVQDTQDGEVLYTQSQLDRAVVEEVSKWDVGGDGVIDLREAIRALKIVVGVEVSTDSP